MTCTLQSHRAAACLALAAAALTLFSARPAAAAIAVVASQPDFADIARQVGGDLVEVQSIMLGPEDVHHVSPKPSQIMKLRKADLFLHGGLDGEPWVPLLLQGARRPHLLPGGAGCIDLSAGITLKEVPAAHERTRALGDIHAYGNTHYALDPLNGVIMARTIADALIRTAPQHREAIEANFRAFEASVRALTEELLAKMAPYRNTPVVTYHRSWTYFLDRFGLMRVAEVEPKPGIAPGPQAVSDCVETMRRTGAKVVIAETYADRRVAEIVAERAGGRMLVLAQQVASLPEAGTYQKLFEHNVNALLGAFQELGVPRRDTTP
jgi:zinc/manganese transport system substrate-binding protein